MAVPQRRISKTRKRIRRTHFHLKETGLVKCPNCGEMILSHRICPKCGFYAGKQVVGKPAKEAPAKAKKPAKKATKKAEEPAKEEK